MRRKRRTVWWLLAGPIVVLVAIFIEAYPFLAITRPSGAKVLVVEGWMEETSMEAAAKLATDSSYLRIYTTGTIRPFTYYLSSGETIDIRLREPFQGDLSVDAAGAPGTCFAVLADDDTLLEGAVTDGAHAFHVHMDSPTDKLRIVAHGMAVRDTGPELFLRSFRLGGVNVHHLQREMKFIRPDGSTAPAWPTYAQFARHALIDLGVPADRITEVPAWGHPRSRSWGNAHAFALQARKDRVTAFDIATAGVHARRSRDLFQTACGPDVHVGVIALPDPYCTRSNWWKTIRGWATVVKEVIGAPEAEAVEITR
jgi:hypothetical protein